jgi:DNA-directed RNA polymerase subunit L
MDKLSDIKFNQDLLDKDDSRLEVTLEGKNINHVVINTLRRVGMTDVPVYSFDEVDITENKSIFNNDYMKLRIRTIPVPNIENKVTYLDDEEQINSVKDTILERDEEQEENADIAIGDDNIDYNEVRQIVNDTYDMITMFLDIENKKDDIMSVTTEDCSFYKNGQEIKNIYNDHLLLIKLKKDQKIKLSAISKLGKEKISSLFSAVSILTYKELTENKFQMILESRGQVSEYRVLYVACMNVIQMMQNILEQIPKNNSDMEGQINSNNLDHTYGNLLVTGMLQHKDVEFAGYAKPHLLDNKTIIKYVLKKGNIYSVINDVTEYYTQLFTKLSKLFDK